MADDDPAPARLLLFGKVPVPGRVKTRLCPPLSPEQAAGLYGAFLQDLAARPRIPGVETSLWIAPFEERAALPELGSALAVRAQVGDDLPQRMAHAFEVVFGEGSGPVVLRNTDAPLLPDARIQEALEALEHGADLVLGPDRGGGYYLVALARPLGDETRFFDVIREGPAETVFDRTMSRARACGLATFVLPVEDDVDLPEDLERLRAALAEHPERAPRTAAVLQSIEIDER